MQNNNEYSSEQVLGLRADFFSRLEKFVKTPELYIDFPKIPSQLQQILEAWNIEKISIYKKWTIYHLVLDNNANYIETLDPIDIIPVFSPSENELNSEHYWLKVRYMSIQILDWNVETEVFESHLKTLVYDEVSVSLPQDTFEKIRELQWDVTPRDYNPLDDSFVVSPPIYWLSWITLVQKGNIYVVLDSDIHFTREELEHIKKELS